MKQMKIRALLCAVMYIVGCGFFTSCENEEGFPPTSNLARIEKPKIGVMSSEEAVMLADKYMRSLDRSTRGEKRRVSEVSSIKQKNRTRGFSSEGEAVAYVINYEDNKGFVVIANANVECPLLAFSESGNIDIENPTLRSNFINGIESFIGIGGGTAEIFDSVSSFVPKYVGPFLCNKLGQYAPYNKLTKERQDVTCPTGSVPAALASVYSSLILKDGEYDFSLINETLNAYQKGENVTSYAYEYATGKIAQLINEMRLLSGTYYFRDSNGKWAAFTDSGNMFEDIYGGFPCSSPMQIGVETTEDIISRMKDANDNSRRLFLVYSTPYSTRNAEAWIIDGYKCVREKEGHPWVNDKGQTVITMRENNCLHCDWVDDGASTGYYLANVLDLALDHNSVTYTPLNIIFFQYSIYGASGN